MGLLLVHNLDVAHLLPAYAGKIHCTSHAGEVLNFRVH